MASRAVLTYQNQRKDRASAQMGQTSRDPLTWTVAAAVTAGAASGVLLAAGTGPGRLVWIKVPVTAATGIYVDFGAVASSTDMFIEPGETVFIETEQEIRCIRAGASDVTVHVASGVVT